MTSKIVINVRFDDVRAAQLDAEGRAVRLWFSHSLDDLAQNRVYAARVQRVQPGMAAAFVDTGQQRAGFWPLQKQQVQTVKPGQMYLLQHKRSGKGNKGDKLSDKISMVGELLVLSRPADKLRLSRRIDDDDERQRLLKIGAQLAAQIRPQGWGLVVRHASRGRSVQVLQAELQRLLRQSQVLQNIDVNALRPGPIDLQPEHEKNPQQHMAARIMRAMLPGETTQIVVDDKALWQALRDQAQARTLMPQANITLYQRSADIFDLYAVQAEIDRALERKLWLKSGAFLVFDQAEALCAIDVNTGKAAQQGDFAQHVLRVNLEAAQAIARQLKLRNISGLVVVDFIDMASKAAQKQLVAALRKALHDDASHCRLSRISEFGLLQLSRQRRGPSLQEQLSEPCSSCRGLAWQRSRQLLAANHLQALAQAAAAALSSSSPALIKLACAPALADYLKQQKAAALQRLQRQYQVRVEVEAHKDLARDRCHIETELAGTN